MAPIEPDFLGEHVAMRVSGHGDDALVVATMERALTGPPLHPADPWMILTVLTRSTRPEHDTPVCDTAERAVAALVPLIERLDRDQTRRFAAALPEHSVVLRHLSAAVAERLAAFPRADESDEERSARARSLNNLGIRLSGLGRREDALAASAEAMEIYRELVAKNRDAFLPDLALSLCAKGSVLMDDERPEHAATFFQEGVNLYLSVVDQAPEEIGRWIELALRDLVRAWVAFGVGEAEIRAKLSDMGIKMDDGED
jgi:tetratricopeptide (TPR) repeat protein